MRTIDNTMRKKAAIHTYIHKRGFCWRESRSRSRAIGECAEIERTPWKCWNTWKRINVFWYRVSGVFIWHYRNSVIEVKGKVGNTWFNAMGIFIRYYICLIKHVGTTSDAEGLRRTEEALQAKGRRVNIVMLRQLTLITKRRWEANGGVMVTCQ